MSTPKMDNAQKVNYFLLADRFYEWCFEKSDTIAATDE